MTLSFSLVLTVIEQNLGRKILNVEGLDVHSTEKNQVFAMLEGFLGELVSIGQLNRFPLFQIILSLLCYIFRSIIDFVLHLGLFI